MSSRIKAKSDGETLEEHTCACLDVFSSLRECYPDIDRKTEYPAFYETIFNALFFHDFGKAASGFQSRLNGGKPWHYRHEILSIPFVDAYRLQIPISPLLFVHTTKISMVTRYADPAVAYSNRCFRNASRSTEFTRTSKFQKAPIWRANVPSTRSNFCRLISPDTPGSHGSGSSDLP